MSTPTLVRPDARARRSDKGAAAARGWDSDSDARRGSARVRAVVVAVTAGAVLAGGTWGLLAPRDGHPAHSEPHAGTAVATVDLPDGRLRVDGLVDKQFGHVMPGMTLPDEVPAGKRRFGVNVSLAATEDVPLSYSRTDFTVSGPGVTAVSPGASDLERGVLPAGQAISGSLSFDVPKDAGALTLRFRDGEAVSLPSLPALDDAAHGGHGAGQAPAEAPAKAPAPASDDHHDAPGAPAHDH